MKRESVKGVRAVEAKSVEGVKGVRVKQSMKRVKVET